MECEEFIKKASIYSKEAILKSVLEECFINTQELLRTIKWTDLQLRFDKLMALHNEIMTNIISLSKKEDINSKIQVLELMKKDDSINKKIDKALKEMDKFNGIN